MSRNTKASSSPGQQSINFDRVIRDRLLESAVLPAVLVGEKNVSPSYLANVIGAIYFYAKHGGECYAAEETIAEKARKKLRHTKRAIKALQMLDLLCVDLRWNRRVRATVNHYQIVWERLFDFVPEPLRSELKSRWSLNDQSAPGALEYSADRSAPGSDRSAPGSDRSAPGSDRSAPGSDRSAPRAHKPPIEPTNEPTKNLLRGKPVDDDWKKAEEELLNFGATAGHVLIRKAREAGHPAKLFLAVVESAIATANANRRVLTDPPRALFWFLEAAIGSADLKGRWPDPGVVTAEDAAKRDESRRRAAEEQSRVRREIENAKRSAAEREQTLESEWGAILNSLTPSSLIEFAASNYGSDFLVDRLRDNLQRSPDHKPTGLVRLELLEFLRERRGACSPAEHVSGVSE